MFIWTISDALGLIALVVFAAIWLGINIKTRITQSRCNHNLHAFNETQACDAICRGCLKNLGFIGKVREQRAQAQKGQP